MTIFKVVFPGLSTECGEDAEIIEVCTVCLHRNHKLVKVILDPPRKRSAAISIHRLEGTFYLSILDWETRQTVTDNTLLKYVRSFHPTFL